jgi:GNAT superfamily N-acetyltransferase
MQRNDDDKRGGSATSEFETDVEIRQMSPSALAEMKDAIVGIYGFAFTKPPYTEQVASMRGFARSLPIYMRRTGFRCVVALTPRPVGFAIGYTCRPGQWWYDVVTRQMPQPIVEEWFQDAFELVDLAVLPSYQGQSIGGRLHDAILSNLPHRTAVLSTLQQESTANHLYQNRGWRTLLRDFHFPGIHLTYQLMGIRLPLEGADG